MAVCSTLDLSPPSALCSSLRAFRPGAQHQMVSLLFPAGCPSSLEPHRGAGHATPPRVGRGRCRLVLRSQVLHSDGPRDWRIRCCDRVDKGFCGRVRVLTSRGAAASSGQAGVHHTWIEHLRETQERMRAGRARLLGIAGIRCCGHWLVVSTHKHTHWPSSDDGLQLCDSRRAPSPTLVSLPCMRLPLQPRHPPPLPLTIVQWPAISSLRVPD